MRSTMMSRCSSPMPEMMVWPDSSSVSHAERRILLRQLAERRGHLFLVRHRTGLHRHRDHRLRKLHAFEHDGVVPVAECVARGCVLEADGGGDVAGPHLLDLVAAVGVHLHHPADPFAPGPHRVEHLIAGSQHPRIDPEEGERADERVGGDLEGERGEGLVVVGLAGGGGFAVVQHPLDGLHLGGRRHVVDDGVQHRLHALVLEGAAAQTPAQSHWSSDPHGASPSTNFIGAQIALLPDNLLQQLIGHPRRQHSSI